MWRCASLLFLARRWIRRGTLPTYRNTLAASASLPHQPRVTGKPRQGRRRNEASVDYLALRSCGNLRRNLEGMKFDPSYVGHPGVARRKPEYLTPPFRFRSGRKLPTTQTDLTTAVFSLLTYENQNLTYLMPSSVPSANYIL